MADAPEEAVTTEQLDSFTEKLQDWAEGLTIGEQALLNVLLTRAGAEEPEVEGFALGGSFGFGALGGSVLRPMVASGGFRVRAPGGLSCTGWMQGGTMWSRDGNTLA